MTVPSTSVQIYRLTGTDLYHSLVHGKSMNIILNHVQHIIAP